MSDRLSAIRRVTPARLCVPLLLALLWSYWPTLEQLVGRWSADPQYTHGYVVPVFAAVVLWFRRDRFPGLAGGGNWWGVPLLALAGALRLAGALFAFDWLEAGSLAPALAGVVALTLGTAVLRWSWPGGVFLFFVLPWPWQFDLLLTYPLRRLATVSSTYALQALGVPALARGNIIVVNELEVGVVEACSGLGMLMTFFALSTAVAFVINRPRRDRLVVFASAVPIGVLMNVARITLTVFLFRVADADTARFVFHDLAGWVMMPSALVVMWLEILWLGRLWPPVRREAGRPVALAPAAPPRDPPAWLQRQEAEPAAHVLRPARPDDPPVEPAAASAASARSTDPPTKQAKADRPLQEIPDVAC